MFTPEHGCSFSCCLFNSLGTNKQTSRRRHNSQVCLLLDHRVAIVNQLVATNQPANREREKKNNDDRFSY